MHGAIAQDLSACMQHSMLLRHHVADIGSSALRTSSLYADLRAISAGKAQPPYQIRLCPLELPMRVCG